MHMQGKSYLNTVGVGFLGIWEFYTGKVSQWIFFVLDWKTTVIFIVEFKPGWSWDSEIRSTLNAIQVNLGSAILDLYMTKEHLLEHDIVPGQAHFEPSPNGSLGTHP